MIGRTLDLLNFANDVSLNRTANARKSVSVGGYYRSQKSGPTTYLLSANLKPLTLEEYRTVEEELINIDDGVERVITKIPNPIQITHASDIRSSTGNLIDITVTGTSSSNQLNLNNISVLPRVGDYIQPISNYLIDDPDNPGSFLTIDPTDANYDIENSQYSKVYQIKSIVTSDLDAGTATVELNNVIVGTGITAGSHLLFGNDVNFKFVLNNRPEVTIIPGPGFNYYQYGEFEFREVLEN